MPPKRKPGPAGDDGDDGGGASQPRRSTRRRTGEAGGLTAAATTAAAEKLAAPGQGRKKEDEKKKKKRGPSREQGGEDDASEVSGKKAEAEAVAARGGEGAPAAGGGRQYWLMKAEPETRLENGVDVSFSIDDLAAKGAPEPWDGIRNFVARNNLRAMKKGDLAFFYHSNCKEPGIAGTMEIVQEHSPDLTAHDPKCPYYDPKSKPSDPRWSVVHVEFRSKFPVPIGLKELRAMGGPGGPLQDMQMLKQSRLSVSRVTAGEWEHLVGVAEEKARAQAGA